MSSKDGNRDDIGGTHQISRGQSRNEARDTIKKLRRGKMAKMSSAERKRMNSYLHGPNADLNRKRRQNLREDDANMKVDNLNPAQQRALYKRKRMGDRIVRAQMDRKESKRMEAALAATDAEAVLHTEESGLIETEHDMERTYNLTQVELKRDHLDEQTARNIFNLDLKQYGPYGMAHDRSGRFSLLYGRKGHVAVLDQHTLGLKTEFYLNETTRDGVFLHNGTLLALAQKKNVFIYDDAGVEIHRLPEHTDVFKMDFLPYHWLLATVGRAGFLKYHDTSTGDLISSHRTKLGPCSVMRQNPSNAIIHLGHTSGAVTLWSPAKSEYLVKMLCHRGSPIQCLSVDMSGRYMVTGGADRQVKIWDLRMYKETHAYYTIGGPTSSLDISQRGVLGIGHGSHTTFWSPEALKVKVKDPYMKHEIPGAGPVETLRFRSYEDVCGIGHQNGVSSIVIPGSGDANLDSMEHNTNPYQDKKQRREAEVRALLDKLSPDMISLDPDCIGTVEESDPQRRLERTRDLEEEANARKKDEVKPKEKKRMRGRSKIQKKIRRKQKNIIDENVVKLREAREKEKAERQRELDAGKKSGVSTPKDKAPVALKRFF